MTSCLGWLVSVIDSQQCRITWKGSLKDELFGLGSLCGLWVESFHRLGPQLNEKEVSRALCACINELLSAPVCGMPYDQTSHAPVAVTFLPRRTVTRNVSHISPFSPK